MTIPPPIHALEFLLRFMSMVYRRGSCVFRVICVVILVVTLSPIVVV